MAGVERLDRVQVATAYGVLTITWDARDQLLREMRHLDSLADVRREFENAGASRPVQIPQELKGAVVAVINMWGQNTPGGLPALPDGIFELRNNLADELAPPS
jgi:hypothetical protein